MGYPVHIIVLCLCAQFKHLLNLPELASFKKATNFEKKSEIKKRAFVDQNASEGFIVMYI